MREETLMEKYFSYQGRINRERFIFGSLKILAASFLIAFVIGFIAFFIGLVSEADGSLQTLSSALGVAFNVALVMLTIRRWHDMNRSGWWVLLNFIPVVNFIALIVLCCVKGTDGPNDFGEDPLRQW